MKNKKIKTIILTVIMCLGLSFPAYAKTNAYVLGNDTVAYEFDKTDLTKSFLRHKSGSSGSTSSLYDEYIKLTKEYGVYAFHDDSSKYVDYKEIVKEFLKTKKDGSIFNLEKFMEAAKSKDILPSKIFDVKIQDGNIIYLEKKQEDNNKKNVEKPKPSTQVEELKVLNIE